MLRFFQQSKPITAIYLSLNALFLLQTMPKIQSNPLIFLLTLSFALPFCGKLSQFLTQSRFQLFTLLLALITFAALSTSAAPFLFAFTSAAAIYLSLASVQRFFPLSSARFWGKFYGVFFLSCLPFHTILSLLPASHFAALLLLIAGIITFPENEDFSSLKLPDPLTACKRDRFSKPCFFTILLTVTICTGILLISAASGSHAINLSFAPASAPSHALAALLLAFGAVLTGRLISHKGVFSGCVLLLMLCQLPLIFLCLPTPLPKQVFTIIGSLSLYLAAGGLPVTLSLLTYYLYGKTHFAQSLNRLAVCVVLGVFLTLPFSVSKSGLIAADKETAVFLFFLLLFSFFCIFSAWKQRFVVLKN